MLMPMLMLLDYTLRLSYPGINTPEYDVTLYGALSPVYDPALSYALICWIYCCRYGLIIYTTISHSSTYIYLCSGENIFTAINITLVESRPICVT